MDKLLNDSSIDLPKKDLADDVWTKVISYDGISYEYDLHDNVKNRILEIVKHIVDILHITLYSINIVGSITSNQYNENSDIDVHLWCPLVDKSKSELVNSKIRHLYITDKFIIEKCFINKRPIQIYYQSNIFLDYMSVGCFNLTEHKWLVGPLLIRQDFNPYNEYLTEIKNKSNILFADIRNTILKVYEDAIITYKAKNNDLYFLQLLIDLAKAASIFSGIKNTRKMYSSPTSIELALKFRNSHRWKIADMTFKLIDKYGYTAIFKELTTIYKLLSNSDPSMLKDECTIKIINIIKNNIGNQEKLIDAELIDESFSKTIGMLAIAFAALLPAKVDAKVIEYIKTNNKNSEAFKNRFDYFLHALKDADLTKKYGEYTFEQACNIVACTLYGEGRGEIANGGIDYIIDSIINRANHKVEDIPGVCQAKRPNVKAHLYSFWNKNTDALQKIKNNPNIAYVPNEAKTNIVERRAWFKCLKYAVDMLTGNRKAKDKNINSYHVVNMENPPSWSNKMTHVKVIGHHKFGYYPGNDPKYTNMVTMEPIKKSTLKKTDSNLKIAVNDKIYTIQKNDTLSSIAQKFKTTVKNILSKNTTILNPNSIKIGQKIKI